MPTSIITLFLLIMLEEQSHHMTLAFCELLSDGMHMSTSHVLLMSSSTQAGPVQLH